MDLVLCGDSLTANSGGIADKLWPKLAGGQMVGRYGTRPVIHEAIGGLKWEWLATLGSGSDARGWCALYGTPSVVCILYGTNDLGLKTMGELPAAFASMWGYVDRALSAWRQVGTRIYLCHLPGPCDDDAAYVARGQDRPTWEYAVATANAGYDARAETIALPTQSGDWPVGDCFHMAAAGYERCATAIAAKLAARTGRTPV